MARTPQRTQTPEDEEVSEIRQDIQEQIEIFQGIGLPGLLNTDIFPVLYKTQTKKWLEMAKGHLQNIATDVIKAATSILTLVDEKCHLCPNARLGMLDILQKFHSLAHERAEQTLVDYMEKESNFPLQATNPAFIQMLEALRSTRSRNATHSNKIQLKHWVEHTKDNSEVTFENLMERVDRMISDLHFDPTTRMENEIHDVLKVHYEVSASSSRV